MFEISDEKTWVQSREDLNFPHVASYGEDRFGLFFSRGRHSAAEWGHYMLSEDGCQTWRHDPSPFAENRRECPYFEFPQMKLRDGTLMTVLLKRHRKVGDHFGLAKVQHITSQDHGRTWTESWEPIDCPGVLIYETLSPIGLCMWGPVVEQPDGELLALGLGPDITGLGPPGENEIVALMRRPGETMWRFKSRVFAPRPDTPEGVNEGWMALLPDGALVAACRTGYPDSPLLWTRSENGGATWSNAEELPWSGVYPIPYLMDNGVLVLIFGARRGDKLNGALSAVGSTDGGASWSEPFVLYDGPGSCYHFAAKLGPDRLLVPYANSQFRRRELPQFTQRGEFNKICALTLKVTP